MIDLGGCEYGIGVPKNPATAIVWYERAARVSYRGITHLGELSEAGVAVPRILQRRRGTRRLPPGGCRRHGQPC